MNMRSPIIAILWENWRLTRVEAAVRLALGIVAGSVALLLLDAGATIAFAILVFVHAFFWMSIAKLNGGRFMDGYKPGFPLYLLYTRPVPTAVFVGVAMAYDAVSCAALYLVSAALLGFAFGQPLPLFSMTMYIVAFHLSTTCVQWSTQNKVVQWLASIPVTLPFVLLLTDRVESSLSVEFSLAENALMALVGLVAFGLTVAGVARQRRGDAVATVPLPAGSGAYPDWLVTLFRFPCPTASPMRAQVWFELRSSGLRVLAMGLALAMLIALLFAISIPFASLRPYAILSVMISAPAVLILGGNAFGIRRRQGRTYVSAFEATQAYGTAQLAGLRVLVRTACVLAALIAVGVSAWTSSSLMNAWVPWVMDGKEVSQEVLRLRREMGEIFWGLTGYEHATLAVITSIAVAVMVASLAAFRALQARYDRRVLAAGSLLLLYGLALALLALAARNGIASPFLVDALLAATSWIASAAMVFTTVYLLWSGFAGRALTIRYACGAIVISAAFGAAWLTVLHAAGMQLAGMPATNAVSILSPVLVPLMVSVLAPWSLNRIRHI